MSWTYVDEKFYATIEEKDDGSKTVFINIYDELESIINEDLNNMKEALDFIEKETKNYRKKTMVSLDVPETIQNRQKDDAKKETKEKVKRTVNFKLKKPAHLKLKIPKASFIVDEVQMSDREKEIQEIIWNLYVDKVSEQLSKVIKENCHGCIYDCPSQRDHDICCNPSYEEVLDEYLENATSKVDVNQLSLEFRKALKDVTPPVSGFEMLKYDRLDWYYVTLKTVSGIKKLKKTLINEWRKSNVEKWISYRCNDK